VGDGIPLVARGRLINEPITPAKEPNAKAVDASAMDLHLLI